MMEAVIVATARTPIGRAYKGALKDVRPDDMAAYVVRKVLEKVPQLDPAKIDDLVLGCALPQGEQGYNLARLVVFLAGLPMTVPGTTVNRFCASSLQAIRMAFHAIKAGEGDVFIAVGVESSSRVEPFPVTPHPDLNLKLYGRNAIAQAYIPMGLTAENVAERFHVPREEMDRYAQRSHERAVAAQESEFFDREIIPYPLPSGTVVRADEGPRRSSTLQKLASLPPAFKADGKVTAGNSCPLNDGAAAVIVMSERQARDLDITPLARIVASSVSALEPEIMGMGPVGAVSKVLKQARMTLDDVDVVELNEAFAAQVLPVCWNLGIDPFSDKLNPHGGAIALGHPFGMTGARIAGTLINDLQTLDKTIGIETMCIGGGQGMAMVIERMA
jgi:acetyl-CoA C-acetyltransferase